MAYYETVIYEKAEDKIYRLTLNRPEKLNALSQKLLKELDSVMDEYESNPDASVLIIRGAGRAFSAGYDLQGTQRPGATFTVTNDRLGLQKTIVGDGCGRSTNPRSRRCTDTAWREAPSSSVTAISYSPVRMRSSGI